MLSAPRFAGRGGAAVRHWTEQDRGTAAVEFALILPLMLTLYLGGAELTQGWRASRKVEILAGTLANLTAQQLTCGTGNNGGAPCLTPADMTGNNGIFTAAAAIMSPYASSDTSGVLLKMTVSQVRIAVGANGARSAKVEWTITNGGGTARPCNGGGPNGALLAGDVSSSSGTYQNYLPPSYTAAGAPAGVMIVADVKYQYRPGFGYQFFRWNDTSTTIAMASVGKSYFNRYTEGASAGPITANFGITGLTKCS